MDVIALITLVLATTVEVLSATDEGLDSSVADDPASELNSQRDDLEGGGTRAAHGGRHRAL